MLGTAEIIGIVSIIVSIVLGGHIIVHSKCFGCLSIDSDGQEIDIKVGSMEAQITTEDIKVDYIDSSGNPIEVMDIPIPSAPPLKKIKF